MKAIKHLTLLALLLGSTAISSPAADPAAETPSQQRHGGQQVGKHVSFGINSYLGNIRHSDVRGHVAKPTAEDRTHYLDAARDLGVTAMRETFMNWAEIEPVQGKGYQFDAFDDIARKASERGIEILALAYPYPTWATGKEPTPPESALHFHDCLAATAV